MSLRVGKTTAVSAPRSRWWAAGLFQGRRRQRTFYNRQSPICSEGKTPDQIARLIAEQCRACAPTRGTQFLTLQAFRPEGGLFRTVEHLAQAEITTTKRRLNREAGQSLVYTLLSEGLTPRRVQGAFDFADEPPTRKVSK